jgi:hypothetical protein
MHSLKYFCIVRNRTAFQFVFENLLSTTEYTYSSNISRKWTEIYAKLWLQLSFQNIKVGELLLVTVRKAHKRLQIIETAILIK